MMITSREHCEAVYFNQAITNLQGADYRHGSFLAMFGGKALDDGLRSHPTWSFSASCMSCPREFKNILHCKIGGPLSGLGLRPIARKQKYNINCFKIKFDKNL